MKSKCCNKPLRLSRKNPEPGETMTEPQLSAEMEKRLKFALANVFISYEALDKKISAGKVEKVVRHFLATALEEQRNDIKTAWRNLHIFGAASVGSAQGLIIKNPWGETDSCQVDREAFRRFIDILNGKE